MHSYSGEIDKLWAMIAERESVRPGLLQQLEELDAEISDLLQTIAILEGVQKGVRKGMQQGLQIQTISILGEEKPL